MNINTRKLALASAVSIALATGAGNLLASEKSDDIAEARQESQIWTTYALNPQLKGQEIKVTVDDGVATLKGKVNEDVARELAEQLALGVSGVKKVDNRIKVDAEYSPVKSSGERSYGEMVDDASITAAVKSKMLWSKHAQGLSANVETKSGKVTLEGTADSSTSREMAGLLAKNTQGVESVDNKLTLTTPDDSTRDDDMEDSTDLGQTLSDSWVTTKVKSTLMYSSNVSGSDISVSTKDGVVTLSGNVGSGAEHALAIELAKGVRGVSSVDSKTLSHS